MLQSWLAALFSDGQCQCKNSTLFESHFQLIRERALLPPWYGPGKPPCRLVMATSQYKTQYVSIFGLIWIAVTQPRANKMLSGTGNKIAARSWQATHVNFHDHGAPSLRSTTPGREHLRDSQLPWLKCGHSNAAENLAQTARNLLNSRVS